MRMNLLFLQALAATVLAAPLSEVTSGEDNSLWVGGTQVADATTTAEILANADGAVDVDADGLPLKQNFCLKGIIGGCGGGCGGGCDERPYYRDPYYREPFPEPCRPRYEPYDVPEPPCLEPPCPRDLLPSPCCILGKLRGIPCAAGGCISGPCVGACGGNCGGGCGEPFPYPREPLPYGPREPYPYAPREPFPIPPREPLPIPPHEPLPLPPHEPLPLPPREPLPTPPPSPGCDEWSHPSYLPEPHWGPEFREPYGHHHPPPAGYYHHYGPHHHHSGGPCLAKCLGKLCPGNCDRGCEPRFPPPSPHPYHVEPVPYPVPYPVPAEGSATDAARREELEAELARERADRRRAEDRADRYENSWYGNVYAQPEYGVYPPYTGPGPYDSPYDPECDFPPVPSPTTFSTTTGIETVTPTTLISTITAPNATATA